MNKLLIFNRNLNNLIIKRIKKNYKSLINKNEF